MSRYCSSTWRNCNFFLFFVFSSFVLSSWYRRLVVVYGFARWQEVQVAEDGISCLSGLAGLVGGRVYR